MVNILNVFLVNMTKSGYPLEVRKIVLEARLKEYYRMVLGEIEVIIWKN